MSRAWRPVLAVAPIVAALALGLASCSSSASRPVARHTAKPAVTGPAVSGLPAELLTPQQIRTAYDLYPLFRQGVDGAGQTMVIIDPFGSPTIQQDLQHFDAAFRLPAPPSFRIIQPAGPVPAFKPTSYRIDAASETSLDVEWAHVMAPAASILLVETPTAEVEGATGFPQIVQAETYVVRHHLGAVISMSLIATEETFRSRRALLAFRPAFRLAAEPRYRITLVAATGDWGATGFTYGARTYFARRVVGWPASDPLVTAVGGTQLDLTASGTRRKPDVAWDAGGGGLSSVFGRPSYQDGVLFVPHRGVPDISMDASCRSATAVYTSFVLSTWVPGCGTSLSAPLFAGIVALADQEAGPLGVINPALYNIAAAHERGIVDVVSGSNGFRFVKGGRHLAVTGYGARPGYDLVTGLGTIDARYFVPELALAARAGA